MCEKCWVTNMLGKCPRSFRKPLHVFCITCTDTAPASVTVASLPDGSPDGAPGPRLCVLAVWGEGGGPDEEGMVRVGAESVVVVGEIP